MDKGTTTGDKSRKSTFHGGSLGIWNSSTNIKLGLATTRLGMIGTGESRFQAVRAFMASIIEKLLAQFLFL